jgi:hypothetical protein
VSLLLLILLRRNGRHASGYEVLCDRGNSCQDDMRDGHAAHHAKGDPGTDRMENAPTMMMALAGRAVGCMGRHVHVRMMCLAAVVYLSLSSLDQGCVKLSSIVRIFLSDGSKAPDSLHMVSWEKSARLVDIL